MKDGPHTFHKVAVPIRNIAQRFAYVSLILAAFGLMMLGKVDTVLVERVRVHMADAVAPILDVVGQPIDAFHSVVNNAHAFLGVYEDNQRLRAEQQRLLQWRAVAEKLEAENRLLREELNAVEENRPGVVAARVIGDTGGAFAHSVLINAGQRDEVRKGQAAVVAEGLVGRITNVGARSARVLLITDLNARIPVQLEPSRTRAILAGANEALPRLTHLPTGASVSVGDRVVTSGHAGVFPPGLAVGQVTEVSENGILVQPYVDLNRLQYVRILDFGITGVLAPIDPVGSEVLAPIRPAEDAALAGRQEPISDLPPGTATVNGGPEAQ